MRYYLFVILFLLVNQIIAQDQNPMFEKAWLTHPQEYSDKLDACFKYNEIAKYDKEAVSGNVVFLANGYAKSEIINTADWLTISQNREITKIEIIYTKYPFDKSEWITNYYSLLANRITETLKLDTSLNSDKIKWELVLQTSCVNEKQAKAMFHGIAIHYRVFKLETPVKKDTRAADVVKRKAKLVIDTSAVIHETNWDDYYETDRLNNPEMKSKKEKKKRRKVKQKCPDFQEKRGIFGKRKR